MLKSSIFLSGSPELLEPYLREFTRTGLHLLPDQYHADNLTSVEILCTLDEHTLP